MLNHFSLLSRLSLHSHDIINRGKLQVPTKFLFYRTYTLLNEEFLQFFITMRIYYDLK